MIVLVVDGYNIIGDWDELKSLSERDLEQARSRLIEMLAEYQAYTGHRVIVVFDAYYVRGVERFYNTLQVEVIFTREKETADDKIEKLVKDLMNVKTKVYVATSDYAEQWTIFSQGALRKSARELAIEINSIDKDIRQNLEKQADVKPKAKIPLSDDVLKKFENWRRGNN
ncbi:NYN domain-containing protein [Alkalibacillus salilacus]|uniref:RNA-binding protein with PIN domain n=1 Tax=Alkalibacillus salilacus TaxID=284582 RepID=A0ABT9VHI6_9BACI|nr:NYN domain-containing protein [Alkalibacillus salilacus]MDQ0160423.1 putative RNA-binding protein with PIN domain [Alkalibacillus salilacus]